jgi:hypothetical protein
MRKKISCKVISSVCLCDNAPSGHLSDLIVSNDMNIVTFHAALGMFTYDEHLQKSYVSTDDASTAKILDYYV